MIILKFLIILEIHSLDIYEQYTCSSCYMKNLYEEELLCSSSTNQVYNNKTVKVTQSTVGQTNVSTDKVQQNRRVTNNKGQTGNIPNTSQSADKTTDEQNDNANSVPILPSRTKKTNRQTKTQDRQMTNKEKEIYEERFVQMRTEILKLESIIKDQNETIRNLRLMVGSTTHTNVYAGHDQNTPNLYTRLQDLEHENVKRRLDILELQIKNIHGINPATENIQSFLSHGRASTSTAIPQSCNPSSLHPHPNTTVGKTQEFNVVNPPSLAPQQTQVRPQQLETTNQFTTPIPTATIPHPPHQDKSYSVAKCDTITPMSPFGKDPHRSSTTPMSPFGNDPHRSSTTPTSPFGNDRHQPLTTPVSPFGKDPHRSSITPTSPFGNDRHQSLTTPVSPFGKDPHRSSITPTSPFGNDRHQSLTTPVSPFGKDPHRSSITPMSPFGKDPHRSSTTPASLYGNDRHQSSTAPMSPFGKDPHRSSTTPMFLYYTHVPLRERPTTLFLYYTHVPLRERLPLFLYYTHVPLRERPPPDLCYKHQTHVSFRE